MNNKAVADLPDYRPEWLQSQPLAEASALVAPCYTDPRWLALEQRGIFARSWQLVGHLEQLESTGDYFTCEVAGVPLLLVRDNGGALRAFHNVCRHRAGPLLQGCGRGAKALRCQYHGWSYRLDGQLRAAPEMDSACGFAIGDIRLPEARLSVWEGLVFVALGESVPPLETVLAGIAERIAPVEFASLRFRRRDVYEVACNWKVYVDNYLEGYHVPHVHRELNRLIDYRAYNTEVFDDYSLQWSPLENAEGVYGSGNAWYYFVYPNVMLNVVEKRLQSNRVIPLGPDRCLVEFDYYYGEGAGTEDADHAFSNLVQTEDMEICQKVQRNLHSGSYFAGRLCPRREAGVHHFHERLRRDYRALLQGSEN
ncbi:aromatic ring-hydroxylating dioxygenase subunit alpha [Microbulbifer magnicolonia]|uniref:aromatic ring-hydroxylating oxygenase subunit alpha n=1 Tax=Microbulbifer magnicolonia TaxID=3109744 RepID=UPI002B406180|nr:aromatic ring-hydroxylating dioxygenase subunit alpha [Microbulbifer sp. GG15]